MGFYKDNLYDYENENKIDSSFVFSSNINSLHELQAWERKSL